MPEKNDTCKWKIPYYFHAEETTSWIWIKFRTMNFHFRYPEHACSLPTANDAAGCTRV